MSSPGAELEADDVVLASGGSGALEMAINCLLNEGDNMLVPQPGFPLYRVIAESAGASVKEYPLLPERYVGAHSDPPPMSCGLMLVTASSRRSGGGLLCSR